MVLRVFLILVLVFVSYVASAFTSPIPQKAKVEGISVKYGTSWSFENASWYGLDPRADYVRLLDKTKFDWVRLVFYWDQMVDDRGELKVDDLKFAVGEAQKRNVGVVIALGAKTPYFPEYHLPQNEKSKVKFGDTISARHPIAGDLLEIDEKLVRELSAYDNIIYWQVENEPFLANIDNLKIDPSLLGKEVDIVRNFDLKHRPIILNHVGPATFDHRYKKLFDLLKPGDVLGVNAYFKTQGVNLFAVKLLGTQLAVPWPVWLSWPVQSWFFLSPNYVSLRSEVQSRGIKLWILEMQADPYVRTLVDADRKSFSFTPQDIKKGVEYLKSSGVDSVGLWGAPFWMYREKSGDSSWLETVQDLTLNSVI